MTIVEVTWVDACSESLDQPIELIQNLKPIIRHNVGYLTKENDTEIVLSAGISEKAADDKDTFTDNLVIPRSMIKWVQMLWGKDA